MQDQKDKTYWSEKYAPKKHSAKYWRRKYKPKVHSAQYYRDHYVNPKPDNKTKSWPHLDTFAQIIILIAIFIYIIKCSL